MNQILIGVLAAAALAVGVQTYRANAAGEAAAVAQRDVATLRGSLATQTRLAGEQEARFKSFDDKLTALAEFQKSNGVLLDATLAALDRFKPQPEDSDETLKCSQLPVPVDLSRILLQPPSAGTSGAGAGANP